MFQRMLIASFVAVAALAAPAASRADGDAREESTPAEPTLSQLLGRTIDVRHRVEPLVPTGPGTGARYGEGEIGVRVPIKGPLNLRGGMRLRYEDDPSQGSVEYEPVPTFGFEVRF